jgi:Arc/MetJ-type ribon-helix-helix transcriptional regulator
MPTKVNFVLDDDVRAEMDRLVESGKRSRVINQALRRELLMLRRQRAAGELDKLRSRTRAVRTREIVDLLRRDRTRG